MHIIHHCNNSLPSTLLVLLCINQKWPSKILASKFCLPKDLKVDGCQSNLYVMLRQFLTLYVLRLFCRQLSLMKWPNCNNLFQIMQDNNFQNLNRMVFTQWKLSESQANVFWYCLVVIKRYTFHYLMKSVPIPGNQSSFEILSFFDTWRCQNLMIFFLVLLWLWI